jgi:hypothetical protein
LTTLNDPFFFDAARALAKRMVSEGGGKDDQRATYGFRLCVSRKPLDGELERLLGFYKEQLAVYQHDPLAARQLLGVKQDAPDTPELAAWTTVANVLLNMDETISKE